ncbi:hypothetical protein KI387_041714, partial [Taxus chinensis]
VGHIEIRKDETYDSALEIMIDGCNTEMEIFSFPFEDEESSHDEEIEERGFETSKDEAIFDEGL